MIKEMKKMDEKASSFFNKNENCKIADLKNLRNMKIFLGILVAGLILIIMIGGVSALPYTEQLQNIFYASGGGPCNLNYIISCNPGYIIGADKNGCRACIPDPSLIKKSPPRPPPTPPNPTITY